MSAQDTGEYEKRKARLEQEIEMLDRQLAENVSRSRSELSRLTLVRAKISGRKSLIKESDRQIRKYADDIYLTQKKINRMNARLDTLSSYYEKLIRNAYKNRDARVWYMYILASEDLGQAFRRYSYFRNLSSQARVQGDKIRTAREELESEKSRLRTLKSEAEKVRKSRQDELVSLQQEESEVARIVSALKKNRSKYEKELAATRAELIAGYRRLAFGSVADAVKLLFHDGGEPLDPETLDLFAVSDLKRPKGGGLEIKFFDRQRALERLEALVSGDADGALPFYRALERSAALFGEQGGADV